MYFVVWDQKHRNGISPGSRPEHQSLTSTYRKCLEFCNSLRRFLTQRRKGATKTKTKLTFVVFRCAFAPLREKTSSDRLVAHRLRRVLLKTRPIRVAHFQNARPDQISTTIFEVLVSDRHDP